MTAAAEPRQPGRYWVAHKLYGWSAALFVVFLLATVSVTGNTVVAWVTFPVCLAYAALNLYEAAVHQGLCPICATQIPVNPDTAITAQDRWLRCYHWCQRPLLRRYRRGLLVDVVVVVAVITVSFWPGPVRNVVYAVLLGGWGLLETTIFRTHSKLMPWCPYCRHRGKDDESIIQPQPLPTGRVNG